MNEILTEVFIVVMYLATMMGMICFLAFVCRLGDLGFWILGWIDSKIQERQGSARWRPVGRREVLAKSGRL